MSLEFSFGFMLMASLLWLLDTGGLLSALLPGLLLHEAGHALALSLCRARVTRLRFQVCGLRMDYAGVLSDRDELLCALAGPAAGMAYAAFAAGLGAHLKSEYLLCSGGISLLQNLFNLLPAPMLDGGRALAVLGFRKTAFTGFLTGTALLLAGALFIRRVFGPAVMLAGLWVIIGTCQQAFQRVK